MERNGVFVLFAEAEGLAKLYLSPYILGVRHVPDSSLIKFVQGKNGVEQAQEITGEVKVEPDIMVWRCRHHGVVCGVVEHSADAHIEFIHIGAGEDYVV